MEWPKQYGDSIPPMAVWTLEQLNARYVQMANELVEALRESDFPPSVEDLLDRKQRDVAERRAGLVYKITWEMRRVPEEWQRRDGDPG